MSKVLLSINTSLNLKCGSNLVDIAAILQNFTTEFLYVTDNKLFCIKNIKDILPQYNLILYDGCFHMKNRETGEMLYCFKRELVDNLDYLDSSEYSEEQLNSNSKYTNSYESRKRDISDIIKAVNETDDIDCCFDEGLNNSKVTQEIGEEVIGEDSLYNETRITVGQYVPCSKKDTGKSNLVDNVKLSMLISDLRDLVIRNVLKMKCDHLTDSIFYYKDYEINIRVDCNNLISVYDLNNELNTPRLNPRNSPYKMSSLPIAQFELHQYTYKLYLEPKVVSSSNSTYRGRLENYIFAMLRSEYDISIDEIKRNVGGIVKFFEDDLILAETDIFVKHDGKIDVNLVILRSKECSTEMPVFWPLEINEYYSLIFILDLGNRSLDSEESEDLLSLISSTDSSED